MNRDIFKAYDIRGIFGVDFEPNDFYQIARAYATRFQPKTVALGHDIRESSPQLWQQVAEGLQDAGVDVLDLGQISTDMLYFAVGHYQTDGGIIRLQTVCLGCLPRCQNSPFILLCYNRLH